MATSPEYDLDLVESVHVISEPAIGVTGVIAVHSTRLGPAVGSCRLAWGRSTRDLSADALRLARAATYRTAMAGLPLGGGQAILQVADPTVDRRAIFSALGRAVEQLKGDFVVAAGADMTVADMEVVRSATRHVVGLSRPGGRSAGDAAAWTALGVFHSMTAVLKRQLDRVPSQATVAVQGLGSVGRELCRLLGEARASLLVADTCPAALAGAVSRYGARPVPVDQIHRTAAQVFAPCGPDGISPATLDGVTSPIICGAADQQLAAAGDARRLTERGILYCPDFIVNAGGAIDLAAEYLGWSRADVERRVDAVPARLLAILDRAAALHVGADEAAEAMARQVVHAPRRAAA